MPFDPRSNRPSRRYVATPRDATGAVLFWALVAIAALGIWVIAGSAGYLSGNAPGAQPQAPIVVPDSASD
ncbi:MAG: hypothetical protein AAF686_09750 [Pseudomonadota bacterium]